MNRRDLVLRTLAFALLEPGRTFGSAAQPQTKVEFLVPRHACDAHTHIFGDPRRFPFWSGRTYTPEQAEVSETVKLHRDLHIERIVLVNSLVYGTDNSCMLAALKQLGPRSRGIALIDNNTTETQLNSLQRASVKGIRLNFVDLGVPDAHETRKHFQEAVARVEGRGWHIQIYCALPVVAILSEDVANCPVPVVFDHFAGARAELGLTQPGFSVLLELLRASKAYVKVSAAYRSSNRSPSYDDIVLLATAIVAANPERVLWGSDWPHPDSSRIPNRKPTDIAPLIQIDDGALLNQFAKWVPDPETRETILVHNPAKLYGF